MFNKAQEAQLVEQKTEDFPVVSSSLTLGILMGMLKFGNQVPLRME